jgi:hypothetical protein
VGSDSESGPGVSALSGGYTERGEESGKTVDMGYGYAILDDATTTKSREAVWSVSTCLGYKWQVKINHFCYDKSISDIFESLFICNPA